jgi:8-amino-7-oxononanoate synthase
MDKEREILAAHGAHLRARLSGGGLDVADSSTHIVPVIVGGAEETLKLAEGLMSDGLLAAAIRPPTVPQGTSRLRIALRATHRTEDVDLLADAVLARLR